MSPFQYVLLIHLIKIRLLANCFRSSITGEAAYDKPDAFIPERWYLYPEKVKEKSVFAPFSTGESPFHPKYLTDGR